MSESATTAPTEPQAPLAVSWSTESDAEAGRDFVGIVVSGVYPYHDDKARFEGEQIQLVIRAIEPAYENLQLAWLPPSNKKGSKFVIFRNHLIEKCPTAWREILPAVQRESDPTKQILAYINTLVGMQFRFVDGRFPRPNAKPGDPEMRMLVPLEYKGRGQVTEVQSAKIQV